MLGYTNRRQVQRAERDQSLVETQGADCLQLSVEERMFLLRRRVKISQKKLAAMIGVSRYWLSQMEIGAADSTKLREFWE